MTLAIPRWYERANEASFKAVDGGHVFQAPSPWVFARPSYYLVNDAEKAQIFAHLGRWRLLLLLPVPVVLAVILPVILFPATFGRLLVPAYVQLGGGLFTLLLFVAMITLLIPLIAVPQIYLARALKPLLADAPRTEERIKVAEQLPKIAASASTKLLVVGLIGGLGMMTSGGLLLLDALSEGHLAGITLFNPSMLVVSGGLLTAYFVYLFRLKAKLRHAIA